MRNARKRTEALIEEAVASNVASQQWGKEMANVWYSANKDLLEFKEAALKRVLELEERLEKHETHDEETFSQHHSVLPSWRENPHAKRRLKKKAGKAKKVSQIDIGALSPVKENQTYHYLLKRATQQWAENDKAGPVLEWYANIFTTNNINRLKRKLMSTQGGPEV